MGVLYDVLFKPIGRGDGSTADAADRPPTNDGHVNNGHANNGHANNGHANNVHANNVHLNNGGAPPEWVLDERDGGSLVWRRYGATESCRRRVEFLDAVEVRVYERDDYGSGADVVAPPSRDERADEDGQLCWADDFSTWDDDDTKTLFYRHSADRDDYPVLLALSVTVLGLCIGLTYVFVPVKWLLHQLLDD